MSTERQASQRGSERGVEMQSVGLGRHDRGGEWEGRWGVEDWGGKKVQVALLFLALAACLPCTALSYSKYRSDVLRIYSMRCAGSKMAACSRVQARAWPSLLVCASLLYLWQLYLWQCCISHCNVLYTSASTSLGAKAGIVLKVASGARDSEKKMLVG